MAYVNEPYQFKSLGLNQEGCIIWTFVNIKGVRKDIQLVETDKYSFTQYGGLKLKRVEVEDEG